MNLQETFGGTRIWEDADIGSVLARHIKDVDQTGAVERVEAKLARLTEVVGRLIEHTAKNDKQALEIIGSWQWEIRK